MKAALVLVAVSAASLPAGLHASCIEDGVAFFQQRAASQTELQPGPPQSTLPNPGAGGITMEHLSASCAAGNTFALSLEPFCVDEDSCGGPHQCVAYYGQITSGSFKVHLESGIQPGDTLSTSYGMDIDYDESNVLVKIIPKMLRVTSSCQYCKGDCIKEVASSVFNMNLTIPTTADDPQICGDGPAQADFSFVTDDLLLLTAPPAGLKPSGNISFGIAIKDSSGDNRVEASYRFDMPQSPPAMYKVEPMGPLSLLYSALNVVRSSVKDALELVSSKGPSAASSASSLASKKESKRGMIFNLTMADLENGKGDNISLSFSHGCNKTGDGGSISCLIPSSSDVELLAAIKLAFHAEEGSTFSLKVKPHLGGDFGMLIEDLIPGVSYTVPLCGTRPVNVTAFGVPSTYFPSRCGNYVIELANLVPFVLSTQDFDHFVIPDDPPMPFLPNDLDAIMPIVASMEMDLKHQDGSRIGLFNIDMGLGIAE